MPVIVNQLKHQHLHKIRVEKTEGDKIIEIDLKLIVTDHLLLGVVSKIKP